MALKDELLLQAKLDPMLLSIGTEKEIINYFEEEWHELTIHNLLDKQIAEWQGLKNQVQNKNNLIIPYLLKVAIIPNELEHKWFEGDFPDIDMDFEPDGREQIKNYLRERWGENTCFQVATWGILNAKSAISSLGRVLGIPPKETGAITKKIAYTANEQQVNDLLYIENKYPEIKKWFSTQPKMRLWLDKILGCIRNTSINASALIIAPVDVTKYLPLVRTSNGEIIIGAQDSSGKKELQSRGFIKFDILGLHNLTIVKETLNKIKELQNTEIDWNNIDLNIPQIFNVVNKLQLQGIFQLDSTTARNVINYVHPENFVEICNTQALIRPGNMSVGAHKSYQQHKLGKFDRSKYPVWLDLAKYKVSEQLLKIFSETYGILLYQEQIMLLVSEMGGFTLEETNKIRKMINISKKLQEHWDYINYAKDKFVKGCINKEMPEVEATFWWETICGNLEYSFNKSHSVSYSMLSYKELYLKTIYPLEFYWSLLRNTPLQDGVVSTAYADPEPLIRKRIDEAKNFGVEILPPDVNRSNTTFDIIDNKVLIHGLTQIKNIGPNPAIDIIKRRPYSSFNEFLQKHIPKKKPDGFERSSINKRAIEGLIWSGAFDKLCADRNILYSEYLKHRGDDPVKTLAKHEIMLNENEYINYVYDMEGMLKPAFGCMTIKAIKETSDTYNNIALYGYVKEVIKKRTKTTQKSFVQILITDFVYEVYINLWRGQTDIIDKLVPGDKIKVLCKLGLGQRLTILKFLNVEKGTNEHA